MILPWMSPVRMTSAEEIRTTQEPSLVAKRYAPVSALSRLRITCHRPTVTISDPATRNAPARVCGKVTRATLLVSTATKSVSSARPLSGLIRNPTGFCMNELAARMKYADRLVPIAAAQIAARCRRLGSRSQPKIHRPMNVDSRKNATRASMASGAPKMSPTKRE